MRLRSNARWPAAFPSSGHRSSSTIRASAAPSAAIRTRRRRSNGSCARRSAISSACCPRRSAPTSYALCRSSARSPPLTQAPRRSPTPKRCCAGSRSEASRSTASSTPSASASRGRLPYLPRERPNPLLGAYLGLGLALRLWRDAFPVAEGGTAILFNRFQRHFAHPTQQPYRAFFAATRATGPDNAALAEAERLAAADPRALEAYRAGRSVHPLLPFADWDGCRPALGRLGHVIIAGCPRSRCRAATRLRPDPRRRACADDGPRVDGAPAAYRHPLVPARTSRFGSAPVREGSSRGKRPRAPRKGPLCAQPGHMARGYRGNAAPTSRRPIEAARVASEHGRRRVAAAEERR